MTVREMRPEDLDQVMEIENSLFRDAWTKEGFFTFLIRPDALFLVAEEKEQILGYCGILMVLDEGDITNVAVKKERQREGIGGFLLDSLFLLVRGSGIKTIHLEVRESNQTAIRLYRRKGFVQDGLRKDYYTNPTENALLMSRTEEA
ncbi:MAG: ribosomal protein S18-alanine N-acetyltransferase [Blautia sp.]|nr:ribosomal protein S18-alanine N-acetyltransferase [Blautia sp.]